MIVALYLLSTPSLAAYATVDALWEPNAAGTRWESVAISNGARVERDGKQFPLRLDAPLNASDRVVTTRGRVRLRLDDDDTITVYEQSSVVLQEWGAWQELGSALYWVQGYFKVKFASGEAVVEGTRFAVVLGDEQDRVEVYRGEVNVSGVAGAAVPITRGASAVIQGRQATRGSKLGRTLYGRPRRFAERLRPRVEAGARLGFGYGEQAGQTSGDPQLQLEATGRLRLPGPFDPTLSFGILNTPEATFYPLTLGVEHTLGPLYAGLGGGLGLGAMAIDADGDGVCDESQLVARPELTLSIGGRISPTRRWVLQPAITGVWLDGPAVRGTVGVSYAF